jgi:hypothetical protein
MKKLKSILFLSLLIWSISSFGQEVIMEQDVNQDTTISDYGKNKSRYFGSNIGFMVPIEDTEGSKSLERGSSYVFHYGMYYKIKANNFYSVLGQLAYQRNVYSFVVNMPDESSKELVLNNASLGLMNRFNFGKRGNYIGYYLSLGASAEYTFRNKLKTKGEFSDPAIKHQSYKVSLIGLDYVNKINYSAEARIGINRWILFGKQRLSTALDKSASYNLPPTTVGVLFDFGA